MVTKPNLTGQIPYQEVALTQLKVSAQTRLSPSVLHTLRLDTWQDQVLDQLAYQLSARILAQHLDQHTITRTATVNVEIPDGWVQQWKADHHDAAGWLIRKAARCRPIRQRTITQTLTLTATWHQYATFPEATIVTNDHLGQPIRLITTDSRIKWDQ